MGGGSGGAQSGTLGWGWGAEWEGVPKAGGSQRGEGGVIEVGGGAQSGVQSPKWGLGVIKVGLDVPKWGDVTPKWGWVSS